MDRAVRGKWRQPEPSSCDERVDGSLEGRRRLREIALNATPRCFVERMRKALARLSL